MLFHTKILYCNWYSFFQRFSIINRYLKTQLKIKMSWQKKRNNLIYIYIKSKRLTNFFTSYNIECYRLSSLKGAEMFPNDECVSAVYPVSTHIYVSQQSLDSRNITSAKLICCNSITKFEAEGRLPAGICLPIPIGRCHQQHYFRNLYLRFENIDNYYW